MLDGEIVGDEVFARHHGDLVGNDLAVDTVLDLSRAMAEGEEAGQNRQFDRMRAVRLLNRDALLPHQARTAQRHAAIDADRHQADTPVPSGMAGGLADEIHVDALEAIGLVVLGEGDFERVGVVARLRHIRRDGEIEAQRVVALAHFAGDIDVVADEGVVGLGDAFAVERDFRDAVDIFERQRQITGDVLGACGERPLDAPRGLVDPHHGLFVVAEIGIRDLARGDERGVHVAGQGEVYGTGPPR